MDNIHGLYEMDDEMSNIHEGFELEYDTVTSNSVQEYNNNNPHGYRLDESMGDIGFKYIKPFLEGDINESSRPKAKQLVDVGVYHKVIPTELLLENRSMTDEEKDMVVRSIVNMHSIAL